MDLFEHLLDLLLQFIDFLLHIDVHLFAFVESYGVLVYLLLFFIVFCETGLVVTPFLPGDSLLFAAGTLAGAGQMSYPLLLGLIFIAAVGGDQLNYSIGRFLGQEVFKRDYRFLKRKHLMAAHDFYEKHGGKAIIIARFVPIIRTFAPFVAGVAHMHRGRFVAYNFTGAFVWVGGLVTTGFFLGNTPWVQNNFSVIVYGIILVSVLPVAVGILRGWLKQRKLTKAAGK